MNSKLAKRIRKWAKDKKLDYGRAKRAYEHATDEDKVKIEIEMRERFTPGKKAPVIHLNTLNT